MIRQIDLVNCSHYDIGFTDHPLICREMQVRYLDRAIDLVGARHAAPLRWTCESNNAVLEWWEQASPERRTLFLEMVHAGWIDVCALPFNHNPSLDAREWHRLAHWLPAELAQQLPRRTIMQNDVNGFPRAGALALMDVGAEFLWMGLNQDTGGSPVPQPSAFWWAMPDGRRLFVWNSVAYPHGYYLFEPEEWRRGPLPLVADTRYRPPRLGDILDPSPENLEQAHRICLSTLERWHAQGYSLERVAVSMTNMWRIDNDPPCDLLPAFIAAWNAAGLTPTLRMTTATEALDALRAEAADQIPTLSGEWTNWWANGVASTPRELSASRQAKRLLDALESPLYAADAKRAATVERCTRQLCFFDEHTWGSWNSVAQPDSLDTKGQFADKALWAYRPLAIAELAVGDANRAIAPDTPGIHVVNPYDAPFTGWVRLTNDCLRGEYAGVEDATTGAQQAFDVLPGASPFFTVPTDASQFSPLDTARVFPDHIAGKELRFWAEELPPHSVRSYRLLANSPLAPWERARLAGGVRVSVDATNWPQTAHWGQTELFTDAIGDFFSLEVQGLAPRWRYKRLMALPSPEARRAAREQATLLRQAVPAGPATLRDTGPTLVYEQYLTHPRLRILRRTLEVFKGQPRAQLQIVFDRCSQPAAAEIFYVRFPLACAGWDLHISNGGLTFRPGQEQIANSCQDFYSLDEQVVYTRGTSRVVLACRDSALVAFGGMHDGLMLPKLPEELHIPYAILYNNIWYTNFAGDEAGRMEFQFDLYSLEGTEAGCAPAAFAVVNV